MKLSKRKVCSVILSMSIIAVSIVVPVYGAGIKSFVPQITAIDSYENPSFAIGELSEKSGETPEKIVEKNYNKKLIGSGDLEQKNYKVKSKSRNSMGRTVISTIQTFNGFSVYGTDQNYHISDAGVIECIAGSKVNDIEKKVISMDFYAKYTQEDVFKAVEQHLGFTSDYEVTPKPEIILYPINGKYHYVYEVEVEASSPCHISCTYYIDADNLSAVNVNNSIRGIDGDEPVQGKGIGQSGESMDLLMVRNKNGGENYTYYLRNTVDNFKTCYGFAGGNIPDPEADEQSPSSQKPIIVAAFNYDKNDFDSKFTQEQLDSKDPNFIYQKAAVDAHSNITKIIRFFKNAPFYRNSQEDNNAGQDTEMDVLISTSEPREGAYGKPIAWGSKNYVGIHYYAGENGKIISCCLDIMAHEYSHGMLQFEGLTGYKKETKAVSEGVGDVFGILAEYYITNEYSVDENGSDGNISGLIGEDIYNNGYLRDAFNPNIKKYEAYNEDIHSENDGGGLISRAAGLMALGGENVNAIGYEKIARIFYNAINDGYLTKETSLQQFASYVLLSSGLLYGKNSQAYQSTKAAFTSVGLLVEPPTNFRMTNRSGLLIQFSWSGTKGDKFALYRKRSDTNDEFEKIAETEKRQIAVNTLRGICDFKVAVVNLYGKRISQFSDVKTVEAYSYAPRNFELDRSTSTFYWDQSFEQDIRYAVYKVKSDTSDAPQKVAVTENTFVKVDIESGYDYQVAIIDFADNRISYFSNIAE